MTRKFPLHASEIRRNFTKGGMSADTLAGELAHSDGQIVCDRTGSEILWLQLEVRSVAAFTGYAYQYFKVLIYTSVLLTKTDKTA